MNVYGEYRDWVERGAIVDAGYAHDMGLAARGVAVAFTDEPTVSIRQADGTVVTWLARLCEQTTGEENLTQFLREMQPKRRKYSIQPPIRPGTARRLGIRPPVPPPQWLVDMAAKVNFMHWQLDMIDRIGGHEVGTWLRRAQEAARQA